MTEIICVWIRNHDLCHFGTVLYQLSYQANWKTKNMKAVGKGYLKLGSVHLFEKLRGLTVIVKIRESVYL